MFIVNKIKNKIIAQQNENFNAEYIYTSQQLRDVFGRHLIEYISLEDLTRCKRVCRAWNRFFNINVFPVLKALREYCIETIPNLEKLSDKWGKTYDLKVYYADAKSLEEKETDVVMRALKLKDVLVVMLLNSKIQAWLLNDAECSKMLDTAMQFYNYEEINIHAPKDHKTHMLITIKAGGTITTTPAAQMLNPTSADLLQGDLMDLIVFLTLSIAVALVLIASIQATP